MRYKILGIISMLLCISMPSYGSTISYPAIVGEGSSFQANYESACVSLYNATYDGKRGSVTYNQSSSGAGLTAFSNGSVAFAGTDAPDFTRKPADGGDVVVVPITAAPISIITNVTGINGKLVTGIKLTPKVLSDIFRGDITKWNDSSILSLNGTYNSRTKKWNGVSANLPALFIKVFARTDGSGTTKNLATYLANTVPNANWYPSKNFSVSSSGDTAQRGDGASLANITKSATSDALIQSIIGNSGSLGYADMPDTTGAIGSGKIAPVKIRNANGDYVLPNSYGALKTLKAIPASKVGDNGVVNMSTVFTDPVSGAYNLVVITYIQASSKVSSKNTAVKAYVTAILTKYQGKSGYVTLSGTNILVGAKAQAKKISSN